MSKWMDGGATYTGKEYLYSRKNQFLYKGAYSPVKDTETYIYNTLAFYDLLTL